MRISNIFGPLQPSNSLYGTLLRYDNESINLGAGNALRDMLYIDDFCNAISLILDSDIYGILNIGSGKSITNREFIIKISNVLNIPLGHLNFNDDHKDNVFMSDNFTLSIEKAKLLIGWEPLINLDNINKII